MAGKSDHTSDQIDLRTEPIRAARDSSRITMGQNVAWYGEPPVARQRA